MSAFGLKGTLHSKYFSITSLAETALVRAEMLNHQLDFRVLRLREDCGQVGLHDPALIQGRRSASNSAASLLTVSEVPSAPSTPAK